MACPIVMTRKPKRLPRTDLSYMKPADALAAALDSFDNAVSILICARREDQTTRFGAIIKRDDLPAYLRFAIGIQEAGYDIRSYLSVLLKDGVEDQDINLVIGLLAAMARPVWRARNLTVDQIRSVSIILSATTASEVSFLLCERH